MIFAAETKGELRPRSSPGPSPGSHACSTDHETSGAWQGGASWALSGKTIRTKTKMSAYPSDIQRFVQRRTSPGDWPVREDLRHRLTGTSASRAV
jgi:hypothetical protein